MNRSATRSAICSPTLGRHRIPHGEDLAPHATLGALQLRAVHGRRVRAITSTRSAGPTGNTTSQDAPASSSRPANARRSATVPVHTPSSESPFSARAGLEPCEVVVVLPHQGDPAPRRRDLATLRELAQSGRPSRRTCPRRDPNRSRRRPPSPPPPSTASESPPTHRAGSPDGRSGPVIAGTCGPALPRPAVEEGAQGGRRLLEQGHPIRRRRERDAEGLVLGQRGTVARAEGEDRPTPAHLVERRRLLREQPRRTQGHAGHEGADGELRMTRRHGREQRERLQRGTLRARRRVEHRREEMVRGEHAVHPQARAARRHRRAASRRRR